MISGVDEAELLSVYIISGCHLLLCVSSHVNAPKKYKTLCEALSALAAHERETDFQVILMCQFH